MSSSTISKGTYLDRVLHLIESIADYFIFQRHVTLSEMILFLLAFLRAGWFTAFGVNIGPSNAPLSHEVWMPIFWIISLGHITAFFMRSIQYRIIVMCVYGFMWLFIGALVSFSSFTSPAVPTFALFGIASMFVAVRLMKDLKGKQEDEPEHV